MQALRPLQRYFDFAGRSGRAEYWQFIAIYAIAVTVAIVLDFSSGNMTEYGGTPTLALILVAATIIPCYAVSFRRLHDVGRSGWWCIAAAILGFVGGFFTGLGRSLEFTPSAPVIHVLTWVTYLVQIAVAAFTIYLLCRKGDPVDNRYGAPPAAGLAATVAFSSSDPSVASPASGFLTKLSQGDPLVQIERLSKLRADGALTDEEFAAQKAELLKRL